jgi:hypothetical protein
LDFPGKENRFFETHIIGGMRRLREKKSSGFPGKENRFFETHIIGGRSSLGENKCSGFPGKENRILILTLLDMMDLCCISKQVGFKRGRWWLGAKSKSPIRKEDCCLCIWFV